MVHNPTPQKSTLSVESALRELDSRTSHGIHVQLLWRPRDDQVSVAVTDTKTGEAFALDVRPGQSPLDVFHHPYAYATETGAGPSRAGYSVAGRGPHRSMSS